MIEVSGLTKRYGNFTAVRDLALAVRVILLAEIGCGLWWLGGRFEKFDLSAELRP